jgi:undecaprenyl-diphosphatase
MDASIVLTVHAWVTSQTWFATAVVFVAEAGIALLPVALVVVWFRSSRLDDGRREAILVGVVAAAVAFVVTLAVEQVLNRPRPFVELGFEPLFPHAPDSSFPSDHTLLGVALGGAMLWRAPKLGTWLVVWAVIIGAARVAAGVHYPSDIIGSTVLGLVLDALVWMALRPMLGRLNLTGWDARLLDSPRAARRR